MPTSALMRDGWQGPPASGGRLGTALKSLYGTLAAPPAPWRLVSDEMDDATDAPEEPAEGGGGGRGGVAG